MVSFCVSVVFLYLCSPYVVLLCLFVYLCGPVVSLRVSLWSFEVSVITVLILCLFFVDSPTQNVKSFYTGLF